MDDRYQVRMAVNLFNTADGEFDSHHFLREVCAALVSGEQQPLAERERFQLSDRLSQIAAERAPGSYVPTPEEERWMLLYHPVKNEWAITIDGKAWADKHGYVYLRGGISHAAASELIVSVAGPVGETV